jgi:hypothetical protein
MRRFWDVVTRARLTVANWWAGMGDASKIMLLVVGGWATPRWFDLYEYFVWSISDENRIELEAMTYVGFFAVIMITVKDSLDRARAAGRDEIRAEENLGGPT